LNPQRGPQFNRAGRVHREEQMIFGPSGRKAKKSSDMHGHIFCFILKILLILSKIKFKGSIPTEKQYLDRLNRIDRIFIACGEMILKAISRRVHRVHREGQGTRAIDNFELLILNDGMLSNT